ncbi:MAG: poly(A) polymerase [Spirochaetales bacterium]|nr:poly(A) polymerase [Spirochaetales bacterium]
MRIRYQKAGLRMIPVARVYTENEHHIDPKSIDRDAIRAIARLREKGFEAYIVGGAVRDLLLGRVPKDFDIATSASPRQIHRLFYNARIIGRRFKLVHLVYGDKIIEVSTFRGTSADSDDSNNVFGTIETDAVRRDFSVNSLYYDPMNGTITDYNDSMADFRRRRLRSVLPLATTFKDDPVRMIRAVKYSVTTGFRMTVPLAFAIRRDRSCLSSVSPSRMTEEILKILGSGCSAPIIRQMQRMGLLAYIMPCLCVYTRFEQLYNSLDELDEKVRSSASHGGSGPEVDRSEFFLRLCGPFLVINPELETPEELLRDIFRQIKVFIAPITPPNGELETAASLFMEENGLALPRYRRRRPAPKSAAKPAPGKNRRPRPHRPTKPEAPAD